MKQLSLLTLLLLLSSCGPWNYIDLERPVTNTAYPNQIHISYGTNWLGQPYIYGPRYNLQNRIHVRNVRRTTPRTRVRSVPRRTPRNEPRVRPTVQPRRSNGGRSNAAPRGPRNDTRRNVPKGDKQ